MKNKILSFVPKKFIAFFAVFTVSLTVHIAAILSCDFAEFFNFTISPIFRRALGYITNLLPFSIAETFVMLLPLIIVLLVHASIKRSGSPKRSVSFILSLLSILLYIYSAFVLCYGTGYHGKSLADRLDLERKDVSAEELRDTALCLQKEMDSCIDEVSFRYGAGSTMPYSFSEMNRKLLEAYDKAEERYYFIHNFQSRLKPIILSEPMTYTHISGVYTYFTGETNINTNFPDYSTPFTSAHEMAHQRGIAPEDEANFTAFLVCIGSDDAYIRYSGYINMYEYILNALYEADVSTYTEVVRACDINVWNEIRAFNKFFEKYQENTASDITGALNNTYLKSQGQLAGTKSYGMAVDLAVAYYKTAENE